MSSAWYVVVMWYWLLALAAILGNVEQHQAQIL